MTDEIPMIKVQVTISGRRANRIRQVAAIEGFNSDNEAVQYLVSRGLEACAPTVRNWELIREIQERTLASQQDLFAAMGEQMKTELEKK
jgi:hypothetical protein